MATTILMLLIPTGWLASPFVWRVSRPRGAVGRVPKPSARPRLAVHLPRAQNRGAEMLTLELAVPGERSQGLPIDNARREWPALAC